RPPAAARVAVVRPGRVTVHREKDGGAGVLPLAVPGGPADHAADAAGRPARPGPLLGLGRGRALRRAVRDAGGGGPEGAARFALKGRRTTEAQRHREDKRGRRGGARGPGPVPARPAPLSLLLFSVSLCLCG